MSFKPTDSLTQDLPWSTIGSRLVCKNVAPRLCEHRSKLARQGWRRRAYH